MKVDGKVAVVTGGARGLGRTYAHTLLKHGAKVCILDMLGDVGLATQEEFCREFGPNSSLFIKCDITDQNKLEDAFKKTEEVLGPVQILINNAGIMEREDPQITISVNLTALIQATNIAMRRMRRENQGEGGVIINVSSIAGIYAMPGSPVYHASKHGVVGFTKSLGLMTREDTGVRLHCLCPSYVKTDMTAMLEEKLKHVSILRDIFLHEGGWTTAEEVVNTAMMLIREDNLHNLVVKVNGFGSHIVYPDHRSGPLEIRTAHFENGRDCGNQTNSSRDRNILLSREKSQTRETPPS